MLKTNMALDGTPINQLSPCSEKRVTLICNDCGKETINSFANYTRSQAKYHNNSGRTWCRKCASIQTGKLKLGRKLNRVAPGASGNKHHSWRGGRYISSDGYVVTWLGSRQRRKEHLVKIEELLGRPLGPKERVHHIDGNKINNDLCNLVHLKDESAHREVHNTLYKLSLELIRAGLIEFNRETLSYMAVDKLRELLEQPEAANQQPSLESNLPEGSTTRNESQVDEVPTSA